MKIRNIAIIVTVVLAACGNKQEDSSKLKNGDIASADAKDKISVVIRNKSPDQAVKSWWQVRDLQNEEKVNLCERENKVRKPDESSKYLVEIVDGLALKNLTVTKGTCVSEILSREILDVKIESETRAIVIATIKVVSPIPNGATPNEIEKKWREEGFKYKYLLEKNTGDWKIVQIYEFNRYGSTGEPWNALFTGNDRISVPGLIYGVQ